jgi:hypothetical protein
MTAGLLLYVSQTPHRKVPTVEPPFPDLSASLLQYGHLVLLVWPPDLEALRHRAHLAFVLEPRKSLLAFDPRDLSYFSSVGWKFRLAAKQLMDFDCVASAVTLIHLQTDNQDADPNLDLFPGQILSPDSYRIPMCPSAPVLYLPLVSPKVLKVLKVWRVRQLLLPPDPCPAPTWHQKEVEQFESALLMANGRSWSSSYRQENLNHALIEGLEVQESLTVRPRVYQALGWYLFQEICHLDFAVFLVVQA